MKKCSLVIILILLLVISILGCKQKETEIYFENGKNILESIINEIILGEFNNDNGRYDKAILEFN